MNRPLITYLANIPILGMFLNHYYHKILQQKRTMINEFLGHYGIWMRLVLDDYRFEYTILPEANKGLLPFTFYLMIKRAKEKESIFELEELCKKIRNEHNEKMWKQGYF